MRPAEELRYLVLAVQREGNRALAAALRPLDLTPSQAEVVRILQDHQPLSLAGLGELLVCESGTNPSRLVDRLVGAGLVDRATSPADRRGVALALTARGAEVADRVASVERELYARLDDATAGQPVSEALRVLHALAARTPAGDALDRRAGR